MSDHYYELWKKTGENNVELKTKLRKAEDMQRLFDHIFELGREIIGLEKNRNNYELVVAKYRSAGSLEIYLHSRYYTIVIPFIQSTIVNVHDNKKIALCINDVQMIDNSIGNGEIAMRYFLEQARKLRVKKIYGDLSLVDRDNFKRSIPFYKKFGFDVKLNDEGTSGSIKLLMND